MVSKILVTVVIVALVSTKAYAVPRGRYDGGFAADYGSMWKTPIYDLSSKNNFFDIKTPDFSSSPVLKDAFDYASISRLDFAPTSKLNNEKTNLGLTQTTSALGSSFNADFSNPTNGASATLTAKQNVGTPSIGGLQFSVPLVNSKTTKVVATGETNFGQENSFGLNINKGDVTAFITGKQNPGSPASVTVGGSIPIVNTDSTKITFGGETGLNGQQSTSKLVVLDKGTGINTFFTKQKSAGNPDFQETVVSLPVKDGSINLSQKRTGVDVVKGIEGSLEVGKFTIAGGVVGRESNLKFSYKNDIDNPTVTAHASGTHTNGKPSSANVGGSYTFYDTKDLKVGVVGEAKFVEGGKADAQIGLQATVPFPK